MFPFIDPNLIIKLGYGILTAISRDYMPELW